MRGVAEQGHPATVKRLKRAGQGVDVMAEHPSRCAGYWCQIARLQQLSVIPAQVPGTEHPSDKRADHPRPLRPHALPGRGRELPEVLRSRCRSPAWAGRQGGRPLI